MRVLILCLFFYSVFAGDLLKLPKEPKRYFSAKVSPKSFLLYHRILDRRDLRNWEVLLLKPSKEDFKIIRRFTKSKYGRNIRWDGLQTIRTNKKKVKIKAIEGIYYYSVKAITFSGEVLQSPFLACVLDNTPPTITISPSEVFSPNDDDRLDELFIPVNIVSYSKDDFFALDIFNNRNNLVKTYDLKIEKFKKGQYQVRWDGTLENGLITPQGRYFVQARGWDFAGNVSMGQKHPVHLIREFEKIVINPSSDFFIYENKNSSISLNINRSSEEHWDYDIFTLKNSKNRRVLSYVNKTLTNYLKIFPKRFLRTGEYIGTIQSFYQSGNISVSEKAKFSLINDPINDIVLTVDKDVEGFVVNAPSPVVNKIVFSGFHSDLTVKMFFIGRIRSLAKNGKAGKTIFTTNFSTDLPQNWIWRGEINDRAKLLSGKYVYELTCQTESKKRIKRLTQPFNVYAELAKALVTTDRNRISPNADKLFDVLTLKIDMSDAAKERLEQGYLEIHQNEKKIKTYKIGKKTQKILFNPGTLEESLEDGKYNFSHVLTLKTGEKIEGSGEFYIDNTPISISAKISTTAKSVSLDEEDINEIIINIDNQNSSKFEKGDQLDLSIYNLNSVNQNVSLSDIKSQKKSFDADNLIWNKSFKKLPKTIRWNGKTKENKTLKEGIYAINLETKDIVANSWSSNIFFKIIPRY